MLGKLYSRLEGLPGAGALFTRCKYPLKRVVKYHLSPKTRKQWEPRIRDVLNCPDNEHIPRIPGAGRMRNGTIVMHNGIRVLPDSYFGEPVRLMLEQNLGVHEPQEERVFQEVLKHMPEGACMLELGAYWSFYSMWFHQTVTKPTCYLVEPNSYFLEFGKSNFSLNQMTGTFIQALAGKVSQTLPDGQQMVCVDDLIERFKIPRLHLLHSDIQGGETDMLEGSRQALSQRKIDYIFISTHGSDLHAACRQFLLQFDFTLIADSDLDQTYSFDGLLVARRKELPGQEPIPIAQKARPL